VWNLETGEVILTFNGHSNWISSLVISQDKTRIVSGSWDKTIKIWNFEKA